MASLNVADASKDRGSAADAATTSAAAAAAPLAAAATAAAQPAAQPAGALTDLIAERIRSLRLASGLSLDALAQASGVSRSMISSIERAESNATAVVLDRLASALDVSLTELLEPTGERSVVAAQPLVRRARQPAWRDPASGYERRSLSAPLAGTKLRLVEVSFPARARVAYESAGKLQSTPIEQQIWLLSGRMQVTLRDAVHTLAAGDCLAMRVDGPVVFFNPGDKAARYLVAQA